jgi:replicative DNA helicase
MGKTALALNIAEYAGKHGSPGVVFSLEMSKEQLVRRLFSGAGKLDAAKMRTGGLDQGEWVKLMDVGHTLMDLPIFIDDQPALTPMQIRSRARRLKAKYGIEYVVVDYLQLLHDPTAKSREQEIAGISRALKALAKELAIPVIALSQLNRKVEERKDKRPILSDLRESGAIEQDADVIFFLYRDEVYNDNSKDKGLAEIRLAKQRNGPTGLHYLTYTAQYTRFENYIPEV